ncbi:MAG: hypothetical protein OXT71_07225 [Acidobacteriota bacterium]|nr:hypothetical protein [Acidobacteriota bacterium]
MEVDLLSQSWVEVEKDYKGGLLNSERCLQASMYRAFRLHAPGELDTFVEPELSLRSKKYRPDLVICEDTRVSAIVEIKFVPHRFARYKRDIDKLQELADMDDQPISIDPATGEWSSTTYRADCCTKLVFAVVARHDSAALDSHSISARLKPEFKKRFFLLSGSIGGSHGSCFGCYPCT